MLFHNLIHLFLVNVLKRSIAQNSKQMEQSTTDVNYSFFFINFGCESLGGNLFSCEIIARLCLSVSYSKKA